MKQFLFSILLVIAIQFGGMAQEFNVVTYNIRYDNPNDGINAWKNRKEMVTGLLKYHDASIFGLQEALFHQIKEIENDFPNFKWIGTGRDDGGREGEFSPIFYNATLFKLIEKGQFWLSENPEKPGLGWDAACNRVCVWAKFKQKGSGKDFFVFNTHFDHMGDTARANSAILIKDFISEKTGKDDLPVLLLGDFNLTPDKLPISLLKETLMDSRNISKAPAYGPKGTFNGFKHDHPLDRRIDYIFVKGGLKVLEYAVLSDTKDNRYPSDHLPVLVNISLK